MRTMNFLLVAVSLIGLMCGCGQRENQVKDEVYHIDLDAQPDFEAGKVLTSKMQIRFVPLGTEDNVVVGEGKIRVRDGYMFLEDYDQRVIHRFDMNGKYLNSLGAKGQGDKEYIILRDADYADGKAYVADLNRIQVYNYDGSFVKTIKTSIERLCIHVMEDGRILCSQEFTKPYNVSVYSKEGNLINEYFPTNPKLHSFAIPQSESACFCSYDGGCGIINYFDHHVYLLKDTVITTIARMDFGKRNIPDDFFAPSSEEIYKTFWSMRKGDAVKYVLYLDNLTVNDDWIIFWPHSFEQTVVYCNRKDGSVITNKSFEYPYSIFFNEYHAPAGVTSDSGEFYQLVKAFELKEMIETLSKEDPDYVAKYPFLKGIDPEKITEDTNDFVIFFKM